jgi:mono/diheme cytochrome c family protein
MRSHRNEAAIARFSERVRGIALAGATRTMLGVLALAATLATPADMQALAARYCVTCHNDRLKTGTLSLEHVDFADVARDRAVLERAARKLLVGAMPPSGAPRPEPAALAAFAASIESRLDADAAAHPDPGRAPLRRLNRTEYANAIHDLLDLDVDVSALLPADNTSYGFDNIADVLTMSPVLMERYLAAARRISAIAVGDARDIPVAAETYRVKPDRSQDTHVEGLPLGTRGGLLVRRVFPLDAEYLFNIRLRQTDLNNVVGVTYPHQIVLTIDGREVHRATVGGSDDLKLSFANAGAAVGVFEARLQARIKVAAGPHSVGAAFAQKSAAMRPGILQPILRTTFEPQDYTIDPHIASLVVTGPFQASGPGDTPSRRRIFLCSTQTKSCATRILEMLAARAFRRPLISSDRTTLSHFYDIGRADGGFEAGIAMGLRRILASPDFVLRIERDAEGDASIHRVSETGLATRLSFFLWSTLPDARLLQLAREQRLSQPAVLDAEVRRMLADPKSRALVDNFAGQWLYLRNLANINPAPGEFPDFDDNLRAAMRREVELLVDSVIHDNRSVVDLMTAADTFVNERLARHYGIPNVYGDHFRRVVLANDDRRGLLGKGAILLVTSLATRTSPVVRGKWILENIVGTPPQPPPPNIPTLDETPAGPQAQTLRERMELHRKNPPCSGCHRVMDPIGFALENYDAIGRWRTKDEGAAVDASGRLMDGSAVSGPASLRDALVRNPDVFVRTMTEKLMTYALGRGLEAADMPAVRTVTRSAAADGYRFSALVLGIVRSVPFQMRHIQE